MKSRATLQKSQRLKSRKQIEAVFKSGNAFHIFPVRVVVVFNTGIAPGESPLKAGFSVSSKRFKKAVDRNRIKRLLREAYRLQKAQWESCAREKELTAAIFFIFTGKEIPTFPFVQQKMGVILEKLIQLSIEKTAPNM